MIGIDFDNTIVCYDQLFHRVACERGLIPPQLPASKGQVRDELRRQGNEEVWTELQGLVYGSRMSEAAAFAGVEHCLRRLHAAGRQLCIISHKTRTPYRGPAYDLHAAARDWLHEHGFFDPQHIGLDPGQVFFELSKQDKLARIAAAGCTWFIDDLPELLAEPAFPAGVERLLFDPGDHHRHERRFRRLTSWRHIEELLGGGMPEQR